MSNEIGSEEFQGIVRCPHCGTFARPTEHATCQTCGKTFYEAPTRTNPVRDFHQSLLALTPRIWATPTIVAANVAVYTAMVATGVHFLSPDAQSVLDWGANFAPKTMNGQWWRLVTSMFLHFGIIHLAFNMWVLWDLGKLVERLVGNVGFLVLYFFSGIAGSLTSLVWNSNVISAGASGAVFGVAGALLGFISLRRDTVPPTILKHLRNSMLGFLVLNVALGLSVPKVDMAAHVGGLIAGFVCGLILSQPLTDAARAGRKFRNAALAMIGAVSLTAATRALPAAPPDVAAEMKVFAEVEEHAIDQYQDVVRRLKAMEVSESQFADIVARDVLPAWVEMRQHIEGLIDAAKDDRPMLTKIAAYMKAREDSWQLLVEAIRSNDNTKMEQSDKRANDADALIREMNQQPADGE